MGKKLRKDRQLRKSDWLPGLLFIYLAAMTGVFGPKLAASGEYLRLILVSLAEIVVIILLRIFLRKQEQNKQ